MFPTMYFWIVPLGSIEFRERYLLSDNSSSLSKRWKTQWVARRTGSWSGVSVLCEFCWVKVFRLSGQEAP